MTTAETTIPSWQVWTGRVLSALPSLLLLFSASMKLMHPPQVLEGWAKSGYPMGSLLPLGIVEILCVVIYLVPRTAILGAILMTGYLGGAVATHVRAGEPFVIPIVVGVVAWLGLWLRDPALRAFIPLRAPR